MAVAVYAHQRDGKLAAFLVPGDLSYGEVISAVKSELGVERALVLAYDAEKNLPKEAA